MSKVLVIDDDRSVHVVVRRFLAETAEVLSASTAEEGIEMVATERPDVVLLDIQLPDTNGLAVFCEIHEIDRKLPVVFVTADAGSETAIEAMQLGAYDYISKPLEMHTFQSLVSRAVEMRNLVSTPVAMSADADDHSLDTDLFVGRSTPMLEVFKSIGRVAKQDVSVLVRGESGTGKELVARALVQYGDRSDCPFLAVNCAALPENLLESELFGHEKGAFTGADNRRIGKFEQADGGTLFLDEIGDMSPSVQAKVLRVLQQQPFQRVGGTKELKTNVRVIAATNRALEQMVREGAFREDLLYRLNTITIELPPLRDRRDDIPQLIRFFLNRAKKKLSREELEGISPDALKMLTLYDWPGNVRQLQAVVHRMVINASSTVIAPENLPREIHKSFAHPIDRQTIATEQNPADQSAANGQPTSNNSSAAADLLASTRTEMATDLRPASETDLKDFVEELLARESTHVYSETLEFMERYVLGRVLRATRGNQSQAAEILGITRGKVRDRIAAYGLSVKH